MNASRKQRMNRAGKLLSSLMYTLSYQAISSPKDISGMLLPKCDQHNAWNIWLLKATPEQSAEGTCVDAYVLQKQGVSPGMIGSAVQYCLAWSKARFGGALRAHRIFKKLTKYR